ncbi:hypothetical protein TEA_013234 [Camellia sinensis var. sinensis]|uniref:Peroxisomal membrane protein n=1 Tax=Camellia sinensis var. sinensis TaxID=542762 RepID=A0A4S4EUX3_CAMSN|nr:hypothetical protein TEA_013234 [Camellia sinensis var. sinensis]
MVSLHTITPMRPLSRPTPKPKPINLKGLSGSSLPCFTHTQISSRTTKQMERVIVGSVSKELDVIPVQSSDCTDQQDGVVSGTEREVEGGEIVNQVVGGFGNEGRLSFEGAGEFQGFASSSSSSSSSAGIEGKSEEEDFEKLIDRAINGTIVLAAGTYAISKLLTIDHDYWHCYEGKPLFEFDRARMFRSGLVGFSLHGSLSHYYYEFCEVVPAKVVFDQTIWAAAWNSIYYTVLGFLRFESPVSIFNELKVTFWPMLTAGWKLWPFAHLITYGVVPVEQRLLWVDCVELIWVTILSTYSNEKSEARISQTTAEANSSSPSIGPLEMVSPELAGVSPEHVGVLPELRRQRPPSLTAVMIGH